MTISRRTMAGLAALGALSFVQAAAAQPAGITVEQPWARAALQGGTGGAFLTIRNAGSQPDRLLSASTPLARAVEIHETVREGDISRMRPVQALEVPGEGSVTLQPGGLHVMLLGLSQALRPGTTLPLTLAFERAGSVTVQVAVQAAGASGPAGHHHH
ncbi:copper chaperone PCu(A)C [Roseomonas sp. SSH11]|uniref:Copper chaperone PCu(A)C n=1 Tax=Pararoseomonas baculiformis TaxID=2820812 RepID=A0ABS4AH43_9PROT|nr:copper chaperone PCu(A)C [Pararoseomonas baculiformis]MBP0445539.1 copper chaperone PCu(A)C [Pararoseomonas baculiformis]